GDREGLAGAGRPQECLVLQALAQAVDEAIDGLGLVAGGLEGGDEAEVGHRLHGSRSGPFRTDVPVPGDLRVRPAGTSGLYRPVAAQSSIPVHRVHTLVPRRRDARSLEALISGMDM